MQHRSISLQTIDCLKQTLLNTLERLKILPGLLRFILSDTAIIRTIRQLTPLIELFTPSLSPDTHKFVQLNDFFEDAGNFTRFLQQKRNITDLHQWYFNTKLREQIRMPSDLYRIFCDRNQIETYVFSFNHSIEIIEWNLCISERLYNETYEEFNRQYGRDIQIKVVVVVVLFFFDCC